MNTDQSPPYHRAGSAVQVRLKSLPGVQLLLVAIILWVAFSSIPVHGRGKMETNLEYRIKAAFLLNFTKYITWPDASFGSDGDPIKVCLLGDSPFGAALDSIKGKEVNGRPIELVHAPTPDKLPACHVIFFGNNMDMEDVDPSLQLHEQPILTVGEKKGFASRGGMINFIVVENKVRFEINPGAVEAASLKISSQLLKLAVIVQTDGYMEK
jgi:hypothetical protein